SSEKRKRLIELAREHGYLYVEDAPYRRLRYWGEAQPTLHENDADVVLHMSSFSKLVGPGPRLGYVLGNVALLQRLAKVAEDTYITPSLFSHGIVYEFCRAGLLEGQIERLKALYAPRLEAILAALDAQLPEAASTRPDGGFFLSLTLPPGVATMDVRARAAEHNLTLADGRGFFADGGGERFLRLPYCALTEAELEEGVRRLAGVVNQLRNA
ncbi:MAG: aminotransferase class I/II-fold pyridoxal phosphate-dependent enzyme, partial [Anaerolineales bacterium]